MDAALTHSQYSLNRIGKVQIQRLTGSVGASSEVPIDKSNTFSTKNKPHEWRESSGTQSTRSLIQVKKDVK